MNKRDTATAVVEGRVDKRDLATILKAFIDHLDFQPRTKNELVRVAISGMADMLKSRYPDCEFKDTIEADVYLTERIGSTNRSGYNMRAFKDAVEKEDVDVGLAFDVKKKAQEYINMRKSKNNDEFSDK